MHPLHHKITRKNGKASLEANSNAQSERFRILVRQLHICLIRASTSKIRAAWMQWHLFNLDTSEKLKSLSIQRKHIQSLRTARICQGLQYLYNFSENNERKNILTAFRKWTKAISKRKRKYALLFRLALSRGKKATTVTATVILCKLSRVADVSS